MHGVLALPTSSEESFWRLPCGKAFLVVHFQCLGQKPFQACLDLVPCIDECRVARTNGQGGKGLSGTEKICPSKAM